MPISITEKYFIHASLQHDARITFVIIGPGTGTRIFQTMNSTHIRQEKNILTPGG
jgi:hypothetical protein